MLIVWAVIDKGYRELSMRLFLSSGLYLLNPWSNSQSWSINTIPFVTGLQTGVRETQTFGCSTHWNT